MRKQCYNFVQNNLSLPLTQVSGKFLKFNCSIGPEYHGPTTNQSVYRYHLPLAHYPQSVAFCAAGHPLVTLWELAWHHIIDQESNKLAMEGPSVARQSLFILFRS